MAVKLSQRIPIAEVRGCTTLIRSGSPSGVPGFVTYVPTARSLTAKLTLDPCFCEGAAAERTSTDAKQKRRNLKQKLGLAGTRYVFCVSTTKQDSERDRAGGGASCERSS